MASATRAKIVHLTSVHPADDVRIFFKMARSVANAGYDTHLVAAADVDQLKTEMRDGVHLHLTPRVKGGRFARMLGTSRTAVAYAASLRGDIYHFHDPELLPYSLRLCHAGPCGRAAVIYDAHEDVRMQILSKPWIPTPARRVISLTAGLIEDFIISRLSAAVTATPSIARRLDHAPKRVVVQNFPMQQEIAAYQGLERHPIPGRFVYAGAISRIRGIAEVVAATALCKTPVVVDIAGKWEDERLERDLTTGNSLLKVHGLIPRSSLPPLLTRATAGIVTFHPLPNHMDAQPNKLFEYMAAGIPVIASNFPLWRELIDKIQCGILVDPLKPGAIADAMDWITAHPVEAAAMGDRGREAVARSYSWETELKKLLSLYSELAGN